MRTEEEAKRLVESLLPLQEDNSDPYVFPCPRCGHDQMDHNPVRNALSRRAKVYICDKCGMDEAMRDMAEMPPLPFTQWGMVLGFEENEQTCRICGCTQNNACEGGCYWVEDHLCSQCAKKLKGATKHD